MTLLAQADTITALEHLILAVIDKAGGGGMAFVWMGVGALGMLGFLRLLARWGIKTVGRKGE